MANWELKLESSNSGRDKLKICDGLNSKPLRMVTCLNRKRHLGSPIKSLNVCYLDLFPYSGTRFDRISGESRQKPPFCVSPSIDHA